MASITFCLPHIARKTFSGGALTICEYANGLAKRGHKVYIVALAPSEKPEWVEVHFDLISPPVVVPSKGALLKALMGRNAARVQAILTQWVLHRTKSYLIQRAFQTENARGLFPESDVTIASSYETAVAAWRYGKGKRYYFLQHFEPLFARERMDPILAEVDARASYSLPDLNLIANSSWLASRIGKELGKQVPVCLNAIDHSKFHPDGATQTASSEFSVISYGGRDAEWKGITEAAEAIRLARREMPNLRWRVFGPSLLPPDNKIAPYESLGFLTGETLRKAYTSSDTLLAPSWYESFPLFPLESMACGTSVITTPYGVEDYARDGQNCLIVQPKDSASMAQAILRLARDSDLRKALSIQGSKDAKELTWERSVARMAELIGVS